MRAQLLLGASLLVCMTSATLADRRVAIDDDEKPAKKSQETEQLVLVNASSRLGDRGQIDRIRRVLDQKGLLVKLPERLEAALDGRNVLIADVEAIRDAYMKSDFATALEIVQADETRVLQGAINGDPVPALAELAQWRGLIAAGAEKPDEAVRAFRLASRLNPAWAPDKKLAGPQVRPLIKKARKDVTETGRLRVDADPDGAMMRIDDGKPQPVKDKLTLPVGYHLVLVTAPGRSTYAEIVEITADKTYKLEISLEKESKSDKAAKLVDATIAAPPGKARLKKTKALSPVTGATRFLVLEDGLDDTVMLRLYDVDTKKVSKPLELDGRKASSTVITRKVLAAIDPDNMVEPTSIMIVEKQRKQHWYERWYVWAGVAAIAGGSFMTYRYMTREPTSIRGF